MAGRGGAPGENRARPPRNGGAYSIFAPDSLTMSA